MRLWLVIWEHSVGCTVGVVASESEPIPDVVVRLLWDGNRASGDRITVQPVEVLYMR